MVLIVVVAFIIALTFSMLGLGGAIVYTPLFLWLGIPLISAIPMALLLNMVTAASASINYFKQKKIDRKIAFPMILTSIAGAFTGSYLANIVETRLVILFLSIILLLVGLQILFFPDVRLHMKKGKYVTRSIGGGLAFIIGIISSLVGIGGGTFIVPVLLLLGLEIKNAAATSTFIITFTSLSGFAGHLEFGTSILELNILLYASFAAFAGAQVGSRIVFKHVYSKTIRYAFGLFLLLASGNLLYDIL